MNITRTRLGRASERAKAGIIGQREEERELLDKLLAQHLATSAARSTRTIRTSFTGGAVAQPAPAQHRLALDYILARRRSRSGASSCAVLADVERATMRRCDDYGVSSHLSAFFRPRHSVLPRSAIFFQVRAPSLDR